MIQYK